MSTHTPPIPNSEPNANDPHPPDPHNYGRAIMTYTVLMITYILPTVAKSRITYEQIHDSYDFLSSDETPDAKYKITYQQIHDFYDSIKVINWTSLRHSIPDLMYTLPINHHQKDWQYRNIVNHKHQFFHLNQ